MSNIGIQLDLFGVVKREGGWYIAHCPPLDITTQGRTLEEAKKNLIEASELFVISCLERGTLEQAFRELGVIPAKLAQTIPRHAFPVAINIPFALDIGAPESATTGKRRLRQTLRRVTATILPDRTPERHPAPGGLMATSFSKPTAKGRVGQNATLFASCAISVAIFDL